VRIPGLGETDPVELGKQSVRDFSDDDMMTYAAALSYHILFALFPFLIFLVALLSFLQVPEFFDWMLEQAEQAFPADAYQRFEEVVAQIQNQSRGGLLSFGVILAIWASASGIRSLMKALNVAYDVEETRPAWKQYALSIGYTIGLAALLLAAAALMLLGPESIEWLAGQIGWGDAFVTVWNWLRWPVLVLLLILVAAIVYYVCPNVDQPFRLITPGAVVAVVVWLVASIGFSIYVSNFGNYNATYGSLGGVIVMLFYFYLSSAVLLLGAEINAVLHSEKLGPPQPADKSGVSEDA
jgi:membrane protein